MSVSISSEFKNLRRHALIGTGVLLLAVNFLTPGYSFGYGEQMLLSIKGISWADKNAFVGDWFNNYAPQPHVLFDVITFFGEKVHFLAGIYFLYFVTSCFVFALGTALLAELWLPRHLQFLQQFVNVLCVVGPVFLLGTFLNIHFQAVPNMAGGCLVYLAIACLLTKRERLAAWIMLLASLFHLQHGIGVAAIAILFVLLGLVEHKKIILLAAATSLVISFSMAFSRDLLTGSNEIAHEAAEIGSTGHLNVETWTTSVISGGLFVLALAVLNFILKDARGKRVRTASLFALIALGPVVGIVADLNNIEPFQSLARSFFVYRFSMALVPFACWFLIRQLAIVITESWKYAVTSAAILIFCSIKYFSVAYTTFPQLKNWWILFGIITLVATIKYSENKSQPTMRWALAPIVYLTAVAVSLGVAHFDSPWPSIDLSSSDNAVTVSRWMGTALTSSDVLASDPSLPWIRPFTRRAIVVDCKGVPYGGAPWNEYIRRLKALGVNKPNECLGYKTLPMKKILALRDSVGATAILLMPGDAAYEVAKETLNVRWSSGGQSPWIIFDLPPVN
jgi:hypothetical protein